MSIYYNVNYYLSNEPTMEEMSMALATVVSQVECSFDEVSAALEQLTRSLSDLQNRLQVCENETYGNLRPGLDALIEKSNQKNDLEISGQKGARRLLPIIEDRIIPIDTKDLDEWYENFLKELGYNE